MGLVSVSFLLVGLALCLLSLLPMLLSNIRAHLGIWLPLAQGIAMVLFGRFYRVVFQQASDAVGWAGFGLLCIFVLWLAVSLLVLALGYPRFTQKEPLCTVVVPGCSVLGMRPSKMLLRRLETACKVLEENPDYSCIVTGGQGRGEDCTEAPGHEGLARGSKNRPRPDLLGRPLHQHLGKPVLCQGHSQGEPSASTGAGGQRPVPSVPVQPDFGEAGAFLRLPSLPHQSGGGFWVLVSGMCGAAVSAAKKGEETSMKDGRSLPKKAFVLWEAVAFIATGVLEGLLAVLLHRWFFLRLWTLWLLGLVAVILVFWYLPLRYLNTEYKLESHSFWLCKGVFWRRRCVFPATGSAMLTPSATLSVGCANFAPSASPLPGEAFGCSFE